MERAAFRSYLAQKGYSRTSIEQHIINVEKYQEAGYLLDKETPLEEQRKHLLSYVNKQQSRGNTAHTINIRIVSIGLYYESQQGVNPFTEIRLQIDQKSPKYALYTAEELESIYHQYAQSPYPKTRIPAQSRLRNEVILSLTIYQCLNTRDIGLLRIEHIDLKRALLEVPSSLRSNGRVLKLEGFQIHLLERYIKDQDSRNPLIADVDNKQTQLCKSLQKIGIKIKNIRSLRQSKINHLVKVVPMRQLQYFLGFKYISTLQDYQNGDLESLQEAIGKYHPLG